VKLISSFFSKDSFAKDSFVMFSSTAIANVMLYLFHIFMGSRLGPEQYGILVSLLSLIYLLSIPSSTIQTVITRTISEYIARKQERLAGALLAHVTKRFVVIAFLIVIAICAGSSIIASFLKIDSPITVMLFSIAVLFSILMPVNYGALQGLKEFHHLGLNNILNALLRLGFGILLVYLNMGVNGAVLSYGLAYCIALAATYIPLNVLLRKASGNLKTDEIIDYSFPVLLSIICLSIMSNVDMLLVKHFFGQRDAGIYAAASTLGKVILFAPGGIAAALFPRVTDLHVRGKSYIGVLKKGLFYTMLISGLGVVIYFFFPQIVILFFGSNYKDGIPFIGYLGLAMAFLGLANIVIYYALSIKNLNFMKYLIAFTLLEVGLLLLFHNTLMYVVIILAVVMFGLFATTLFSVLENPLGSIPNRFKSYLFILFNSKRR